MRLNLFVIFFFHLLGHKDVDIGCFTFLDLLGTETIVERNHQMGFA